MTTINRERIKTLTNREEERFVAERPESKRLFERAKSSLLTGVPMTWMVRWPGAYPLFVKEAKGAYLTDVDGHRYLDLCLGDTGSMLGHSPPATSYAIAAQVYNGMTFMLPTENAIWAGEELSRRFGLPFWQIYLTATDANRFAIRMARQITRRNLILIFDGCFHGSVDEALVKIKGSVVGHGKPVVGQLPDPERTTKVIQFNDLGALEEALEPQDVACVLCEPAMTNTGIIMPDPGYHKALREITRRTGTLLIMDETHTICAGPGGCTRIWNLEPDFLTLGKAIAGGLPTAILGLSQDAATRLLAGPPLGLGIGGTLAGNALQAAALKATLQNVLTQSNFDHMITGAAYLENAVGRIIKEADLPWHVIRFGCRAEYCFVSKPPRNGPEARAAFDDELDKLIHIYLLNRGILLTPFHSMVLVSPATSIADIDFHNKIFNEFVDELVG